MKQLLVYFILILCLFSCKSSHKQKKEAGICLSFDDKSIDEWYLLLPLFKKYNATATFLITKPQTLTEEEIQKLKLLQEEGFEIGFHGYHHKSAEHYIKKHSYQEYLENEIKPGIRFMDSIEIKCTSFAYPYGAEYWFTDYILLKHFKTVRDVSPLNTEKDLTKINDIYYTFNQNRSLSAISIDTKTGLTTAMINQAMDKAYAHSQVLLLYGHRPTENPDLKGYTFQVNFLEQILSSAHSKGLKFYTLSQLD